ncbi:hypothetical protein [Legionella genomosp. 1]|uniref:hypothetical protein n=1 Tax=Legionella genomosp. 1 TaxID=1093625 RepID=UPI00105583BD|nr:hypothetical protein [Legionella genomosp. 1]
MKHSLFTDSDGKFSLKIKPDDKFFVAICKRKDNPHSFSCLGVIHNNIPLILAGFGKYKKKNATRCEMAFWQAEGVMYDESILLNTSGAYLQDVTYKAFEIDYESYKRHMAEMATFSSEQVKRKVTSRYLSAFQPVEENEDEIIFQHRFLRDLTSADTEEGFKPDYCEISQRNTCRHTAVDMTRRATLLDDLGKGVSRLFFRRLPLSMRLNEGLVETDHFFLLPPPPNAFTNMHPKTLAIAKRLYSRLDEMIQIGDKNPITCDKFEAIKQLYNETTQDYACDYPKLIHHIEDWLTDKRRLIGTHRNAHWFQTTTASTKMFNEILDEYKKPSAG